MFLVCEYPNLPGPPIQPRLLPIPRVGLRIIVNEEGISHIQLNHGELVIFRDVVEYPEAIRTVA